MTMTKQELVDILKKLFRSDVELDFLLQLKEEELQTLVACVRSRLDSE